MQVTKTVIEDVLVLEPRVFGDTRGFFYESFNQRVFEEAIGQRLEFVQDNHSKSAQGVLRGLHFQREPRAQGKLVRVVAGEVFDVAVDIRKESPTYGQWFGAVLSAENNKQMWIPAGLAHGFLVLSESAYSPQDFVPSYINTCRSKVPRLLLSSQILCQADHRIC